MQRADELSPLIPFEAKLSTIVGFETIGAREIGDRTRRVREWIRLFRDAR